MTTAAVQKEWFAWRVATTTHKMIREAAEAAMTQKKIREAVEAATTQKTIREAAASPQRLLRHKKLSVEAIECHRYT